VTAFYQYCIKKFYSGNGYKGQEVPFYKGLANIIYFLTKDTILNSVCIFNIELCSTLLNFYTAGQHREIKQKKFPLIQGPSPAGGKAPRPGTLALARRPLAW